MDGLVNIEKLVSGTASPCPRSEGPHASILPLSPVTSPKIAAFLSGAQLA